MNKIPEEKLNIPGDYQYKALHSKNVFLSNWHGNKMAAVRSLIDAKKTSHVLDIGGGSGIFEYLYTDDFYSITVVDYHKKALQFVEKMAQNNSIKNIKTKKLSIKEISTINPDNKFDVVLLLDVIEHISNKEVSNLLTHVKKILSKDGVFIVTTPNYKGLWPLIEFAVDKTGLVPKMRDLQHVNHFNKKSLISVFSEHGYKSTFVSTINTYSFLFPNKSFSKKLVSFEMNHSFPYGNLLIGCFVVSKNQ